MAELPDHHRQLRKDVVVGRFLLLTRSPRNDAVTENAKVEDLVSDGVRFRQWLA